MPMIRLAVFLLIVGAFAACAAWLADNPGDVVIRWFDYEAVTSVGVLVLIGCLFGALAVGAYRLGDVVTRGPRALARGRRERRLARRLSELTRGFAAAAIGDAGAAKRHLKAIGGAPEVEGLARLLTARVAEVEEDRLAAEEAYRSLLDNPDTEFLGLRGLYETAVRQGDRQAALEFATRAFQLKPKSAWVASSLFLVQAQSGAFDLARQTIEAARRSKIFTPADARRREGMLRAGEALGASALGETERAAELAQKALEAVPGIIPMAVLVAKAQLAKGQTWSAAGTLESAWRAHPHPDIAALYRSLRPDETPEARASRMYGLAEFKQGHLESRLLIAREALTIGDTKRALRALRPLLMMPSARIAMLMSEIEARRGRAADAAEWRERAIRAPRDAQWSCTNCGRDREQWLPLCDSCGALDSFAWGTSGNFAGASLVVPPPDTALSDEADEAPAAGKPARDLEAVRPAAPEERQALSQGRVRAEIFVPPRPPDDPGIEDSRPALSPYG